MKNLIYFFAAIAIVLSSCQKEPTACFTTSSTQVNVNQNIDFTACATDADGYEWDFGDGTTSTEKSPSHSYGATGAYAVKLKVKSKSGKKIDYYSQTVIVDCPDGFEGSDCSIATEEVETEVIYITVYPSDWQASGTSGQVGYQWYVSYYVPSLGDDVLLDGAVMVTYINGTDEIALPYTFPYNGYTASYRFWYDFQELGIQRFDSDLATIPPSNARTYKITLLKKS